MTMDIATRQEITPAQFDAQIEAAQHKAKSLKAIVDSQGLAVKIGPSEHLKVEAWLTIAAGYGYSPRIAWSRALDGGGYEAKAELVDTLGTVIAAGEAECGTEGDDNWLDKPAFQQRSMAQTRATVKACRAKLAWVVVLAGYSPTPAEEMHDGPAKPKSAQPIPSEFLCPIHKTEWFKRGNMRGYAHPIEGTKSWCNREDVQKAKGPLGADDGLFPPETAPAQAPAATESASAPAAAHNLTRLSDLWNAGIKELLYRDKKEMLAALGIPDDALVGDLNEAWAKLVEYRRQHPRTLRANEAGVVEG